VAHISSLHVTGFRCYDSARIDDLPPGPVVLHGPNGAGKTNILEAVSLLAPGRGLRGAKVTEIQRFGGGVTPWSVSALAETPYGSARIGTGADLQTGRRIVRINGAAAKGQGTLGEYLACVWLTPQMDRLFLDSAGTRRRFLDRLVYAFDMAHAGRVARYENAMAQRAKLLKDPRARPDPLWLAGLEESMAETGAAIAAARVDFIRRLQTACDCAAEEEKESGLFPRARIAARGTVEELLDRAPALEVEDMLRYQLKQSRAQDSVSGGAASGPHKSDLIVHYAERGVPAEFCSTGEQKALLIGIVLAHSRLIRAERGAPPILLLDEVAAHLDENRRRGLYDLLLAMKGQVWMTGTDSSLFDALPGEARRMEVRNAAIHSGAAEKAA
jgi:DNA replication and repair protein RecF